jgi:hypothetical protein
VYRAVREPLYREGNKREPLPPPTDDQLEALERYGWPAPGTDFEAARLLAELRNQQGG